MQIQVPRVIFSGLSPRVGLSTIHTGWVLLLQKKRIAVAPCVVGANLTQTSLYSRLTRRLTPSIDRELLSTPQVHDTLARAGVGADLISIEGGAGLQKGLFNQDIRSADIELAKLIKCPIIVVVDYSSIQDQIELAARGIASLAAEEPLISGVVVNRIPSSVDPDRVRSLLSKYITVVGVIPEIDLPGVLPETSLSGLEYIAKPLSRAYLLALTELMEKSLDHDLIIEIAKKAESVNSDLAETAPRARQVRIAVAEDGCFSFGFRDNLDLLRYYGAELVSFSPLTDVAIPSKVQGVFLPGSNLHEYGSELSQNHELAHSIYNFFGKGGLILTEGSSTALLCETFTLYPGSEPLSGMRVLPGDAKFYPGFTKRQLSRVVEESSFAEVGSIVRGVTNEEWQIEHRGGIWNVMESVLEDGKTIPEGFSSSADVLATVGHLHFGSNPSIARRIVDRCLKLQATGKN